jgi:hypothetical protein
MSTKTTHRPTKTDTRRSATPIAPKPDEATALRMPADARAVPPQRGRSSPTPQKYPAGYFFG